MNVSLNLKEDATAHLFARGFVGDNGKSLNVDAIEAEIAEMDREALGEVTDYSERRFALGNV
jgi:hypothetical protein|tara:strand:- start:35 stop:220 length:186 start_codon:yes stop_codon:yes gene_type:complete